MDLLGKKAMWDHVVILVSVDLQGMTAEMESKGNKENPETVDLDLVCGLMIPGLKIQHQSKLRNCSCDIFSRYFLVTIFICLLKLIEHKSI
jgi:hypothetical protein